MGFVPSFNVDEKAWLQSVYVIGLFNRITEVSVYRYGMKHEEQNPVSIYSSAFVHEQNLHNVSFSMNALQLMHC